MVQRGADPAFYPVGPGLIPQEQNGMLYTSFIGIATEVGDVYKFQWISDCSSVTLEPTPVDVGLLGVPNDGIRVLSVSLVAARA